MSDMNLREISFRLSVEETRPVYGNGGIDLSGSQSSCLGGSLLLRLRRASSFALCFAQPPIKRDPWVKPSTRNIDRLGFC